MDVTVLDIILFVYPFLCSINITYVGEKKIFSNVHSFVHMNQYIPYIIKPAYKDVQAFLGRREGIKFQCVVL